MSKLHLKYSNSRISTAFYSLCPLFCRAYVSFRCRFFSVLRLIWFFTLLRLPVLSIQFFILYNSCSIASQSHVISSDSSRPPPLVVLVVSAIIVFDPIYFHIFLRNRTTLRLMSIHSFIWEQHFGRHQFFYKLV